MDLFLPFLAAVCAGCGSRRGGAKQAGPAPGEETAPGETAETSATEDSGTGSDSAGTDWLVPPTSCEPPADLPVDPLALVGEDVVSGGEGSSEFLLEMVDIEVDLDGGLAWAVGQGGLVAFDISDPTRPELLTSGGFGRFHHVELGDGTIWATHRDIGLDAFDASNPSSPASVGQYRESGLEGMARSGDRLYVVSREGELVTLDVSDPRAPSAIHRAPGLGSPWDLALGDGVAWVADNALGVVPVDLTDPDAPAVGEPIDLAAGVQDVVQGNGVLYAAVGGDGIAVLDIAEPLAPLDMGRIDYGASVQSVALDGTTLWAVNQEDVLALDVSDPQDPGPLASEKTEQWAMHVAAGGGTAWVADWGALRVYSVDATLAAPDLDVSSNEVLLRSDPEVLTIALANRGAAHLHLAGATVDDVRFSLAIDRLDVAPGEDATLQVTWSGGEDAAATICLASDDPDEPIQTVSLTTGATGEGHVGEPAPDFALTDIDGVTWSLGEQIGHPVVLVYFATW